MKKHFILLLTYFLLNNSAAVADGDTPAGLKYESLLPDFNQITPEAASLGRYGTIGMSEYTGVPDIKVPLFDIKAGELSVPIYLYYDASGIKVEQEATFVGLGWNLSYGGCITHIICGTDDFCSVPNESEQFCRNVLDSIFALQLKDAMALTDIDNITTPLRTYLNFLPYDCVDPRILSTVPTLYSDEENADRDATAEFLLDEISRGYHIPDIFQASFCGHSVSFVIDYITNEPIIFGDNATKYRIECIWQNSPYPNGFVITDDYGTAYRFTSFCEYSNRKDSYFLESVTDLTGQNWIKYSYMQGDLGMISQLSFFQSLGKAIKNTNLFEKCRKRFVEEHNSWGCETYVMKKVYPTKIETPQETVIFNYEERTDALHGLRVKDITSVSKNGTEDIHRAGLQYDYFKEEWSGGLSTDICGTLSDVNRKERLKLTGVAVDGKRYGFMYDERHPLPYRTSLSQDFWGYYNGANNNKKNDNPHDT